LVLYFKAPHSFTGEDVIELQGHGGVILQNLLLARVFELGAKQATAGEFSYRAFDNDKLDLVQAEAIADAIDATSAAAASSAIRSLSGEFSDKINQLLEQLIHLRLHVEAAIDFPDEEDVDFLSDGVIQDKLEQTQAQIQQVLATAKQGQMLRDGIHVVLAGRPNAGKSSLLNRLAGQERAIVTEVAGTTRDTLSETVVLNGLTLHLTDTAGLRDTEDTVERIGIERARTAITQADILLLVYDVTRDIEGESTPLQLAEQLFGELPEAKRLLIIANKSDLLATSSSDSLLTAAQIKMQDKGYEQINVSCETGAGIEDLVDALCAKVGFHPPENSLIARTRHLDALRRTASYLSEAHEQLIVFKAGELVAESLRQAQGSLGEITGEFSADDLLGKIFGSFCIGK
jgi:tRNA modification GTPase